MTECKIDVSLMVKIKKGMFRELAHVERMNEEITLMKLVEVGSVRVRHGWIKRQIFESLQVKSQNHSRLCKKTMH